jgi:hypothetical protein
MSAFISRNRKLVIVVIAIAIAAILGLTGSMFVSSVHAAQWEEGGVIWSTDHCTGGGGGGVCTPIPIGCAAD